MTRPRSLALPSSADDPLLVGEYAAEVFQYLRNREASFMPRADYMSKQRYISAYMRAILIDWLVDVASEYRLHTQTLCLAVNYVDRFLSKMSVQRSKLQARSPLPHLGRACTGF